MFGFGKTFAEKQREQKGARYDRDIHKATQEIPQHVYAALTALARAYTEDDALTGFRVVVVPRIESDLTVIAIASAWATIRRELNLQVDRPERP